MLLKNSKAPEQIATENANLFVRIGKAILDVLEKAAEDEGLKQSEEIDDSRLTGYRARDRMNKEGELINDFYQALSKKQWATYYRQIANGGYLSSKVGDLNVQRIDDKLVFSEKQWITGNTQDFQVIAVWKFSNIYDIDSVYYYVDEIFNEMENDYDKNRIREITRRILENYDKEKPLFSIYSRASSEFHPSYSSEGSRFSPEEIYRLSVGKTGRERVYVRDKRYSEGETGVSSEGNNESDSRDKLKFSEETSEEFAENEKRLLKMLLKRCPLRNTTNVDGHGRF